MYEEPRLTVVVMASCMFCERPVKSRATHSPFVTKVVERK